MNRYRLHLLTIVHEEVQIDIELDCDKRNNEAD